MGLVELILQLRAKTRVIYQSIRSIKRVLSLKSCFEVCISGHLCDEKDFFRLVVVFEYLL